MSEKAEDAAQVRREKQSLLNLKRSLTEVEVDLAYLKKKIKTLPCSQKDEDEMVECLLKVSSLEKQIEAMQGAHSETGQQRKSLPEHRLRPRKCVLTYDVVISS